MSVYRTLVRQLNLASSSLCFAPVSLHNHPSARLQLTPLACRFCAAAHSRTLSNSAGSSNRIRISTSNSEKSQKSADASTPETCSCQSAGSPGIGSSPPSQTRSSSVDHSAVNELSEEDLKLYHYDRRFVTVLRAMDEFMLKQSDLESLGSTRRRSAFENEPPMMVYRLSDVRKKALEKWGSLERLSEEKNKRESWMLHQETLFSVKKMLKDYRRSQTKEQYHEKLSRTLRETTTVVYTAVAVNALNVVAKGGAFLMTGSSSLFSETMHSIADTVNQLILALGIHKSSQRANIDHPYGYSNVRYVASLISGVGIFCLGSGVALFHGFCALYSPAPLADFHVAYCILAGSLLSESVTLAAAVRNVRRNSAVQGRSFWSYVRQGSDPSVNVVLLEDIAAVLGVFIAGTSMALSAYTGNMMYDAVGSMVIGALLGSVASFIIYTNAHALVGRSISPEELERINLKLENDIMVRGVYDVKGIDMGNGLVRYKAEVDFDGRQLTRKYLERVDNDTFYKQLVELTPDKANVDKFLLKHGEAIVDMMGAEVDRIESEVKKSFPQVRHIDLEIL